MNFKEKNADNDFYICFDVFFFFSKPRFFGYKFLRFTLFFV